MVHNFKLSFYANFNGGVKVQKNITVCMKCMGLCIPKEYFIIYIALVKYVKSPSNILKKIKQTRDKPKSFAKNALYILLWHTSFYQNRLNEIIFTLVRKEYLDFII